jgi:DNA replication ATP-dependent helicase Dna2
LVPCRRYVLEQYYKAISDVQSEGELHHSRGEDPSILAINGLHEVEEDIWSPKWGLKGKVDASVQVGINRNPSKPGSVVEENVAPLEIKTGRSVGVMAHRAQTMLYTLLMEDRYGKLICHIWGVS